MNTRQQDIVTLVERHGEVTIKELANRLKVSEMTVHRDLEYLQRQKYLYKKRGAAVFIENTDRANHTFYTDEKNMIGKTAAELIEAGQSVIFDNSTTALACAKHLEEDCRLTFYATGLESARVLAGYRRAVLYCSGGYYSPDSEGFIGAEAERFVSSVQADVAIIGTSGITLENGITTPYPMHVPLQRKIIASAKRVILVADHSKFGKVAMERVAPIEDVDLIITDSGIEDEVFSAFIQKTKIMIAQE